MRSRDHKPNIEPLKRFSSRILTKDRGASPFFSGRSQESEDVELGIEGVMEKLRVGRPRPASDETWLFQGSPGAGKSALLEKLTERWNATDQERAPIALYIRPDIIQNQARLVAKVADAVATTCNGTKSADKLHQIVAVDHGGMVDIGGEFLIEASTQTREEKPIVTNRHELSWENLTRIFPRENWKRPVVLLLDEAQGLRRWKGSSEISNLHQGIHGLPIITIFAGLSDSFDVLRTHGISRMSHRRRVTLGALEQQEAEAAVMLMLDTFRVGGEHHCDWARQIARDCNGWPQHLQTGLQALAKAAVDNDGLLGPTEGAFADTVLKKSETYRNEYYGERLDHDLAGSIGLLHIALDAARPPGKTLAELKNIITEHANDRKEYKYQLPNMLDASMFLNRLIERGFLQQAKSGHRFVCPIPSMADYISKLATG